MGRKIGCPRCQHAKSWSIRRGKSRCAACHYEWVPRALPLRLSPGEWRRLLRWFVLGQSAEVIAQEARLERKRVLRALIVVRQAMVRDVPHVFSGVVEVDETYLGGSWRNRRLAKRVQGTKRGRGTTKQAVFGILCRGGLVWAQVVPNVEAKTLLPLLHQRVQRGSIVCSDTFTSYTGVAAGGYVHRLVDPTARRSAIGKGATSTAWRASGVISSGVWQPKGESAENGCPSILLSMSGATIIGVCWDQNRLRHCSSCFKANPVAKTGLYPSIIATRNDWPCGGTIEFLAHLAHEQHTATAVTQHSFPSRAR